MISVIIPSHNEPNAQKVALECGRLLKNEAEIIIAHDPDGKGKGWAVREGVKKAKGNYIAYIDGDGDIEPYMFIRMIPFVFGEYDICVGEKKPSGSLKRRLLTIASRLYIKLLFGLNVDTQTGIKIFKSYILKGLWKEDRWLFDIELLAMAKKSGCSIVGVPVIANVSKEKETIDIIKTLKESIKLRMRL